MPKKNPGKDDTTYLPKNIKAEDNSPKPGKMSMDRNSSNFKNMVHEKGGKVK